MHVLVTGGAGFIGSNLVRALLSGGHRVSVFDDLSTGRAENLDPRAEFRRVDILGDDLAALVAQSVPDAVVHLAAQASVVVSLRDPERDRAVNAEGTRRVAAAARDAGVHRVISASTAAVYGEPAELPLTEESRKEPTNPYGTSKLEAEALLAAELEGTATDFASFRFSNVYGPRQDAAGEGGVVAIFCDRIRAGNRPVVFGDGAQTRDFVYVGDVVAAVIAALFSENRLSELGPAFNISTGERTSIDALIMALRQAAQYLGAVDHEPARAGDIVHSVLDPSRAASAFGWRANVPLETGVALTWRWFESRS